MPLLFLQVRYVEMFILSIALVLNTGHKNDSIHVRKLGWAISKNNTQGDGPLVKQIKGHRERER